MKKYIVLFFSLILLSVSCPQNIFGQSVRQERRLINEGNRLYNDGKFPQAAGKYEAALKVNGGSAVAFFNLGLSQIKQVKNPKDTTDRTKALLSKATENLKKVAVMGGEKPMLASKANYSLGNLSFNMEDYAGAISSYKQALRLNPNDNAARKNLRIAQLKQQQNENKDKNQDQNKDQNKDQQDQQDKKDQQNQQDKQDQQQQQPKQNQLDQQTAEQILNAVNNKEAATRSKYNASKAAKKGDFGKSNRNW